MTDAGILLAQSSYETNGADSVLDCIKIDITPALLGI